MARHADDTRNRGVAGWIIGSSIAGVVLVAALIAYFVFLRNDASEGADTGCSGSSTVQVVAGASAPALSQIADAYNATRPAARGVCVSVQVSALSSADAADALLAGWTNQAVPPPAIWVADTGADVTAVESGAAELVAGHSETLWASSPVVLAVSHLEADSVPADLAWTGLPAATDSDNGVTLAGDRRLSLALGDPRTDLGTAFALESVVGSGSADAAVQPDQVTSAAGALSALAGQSARTADVAGLLDDVSAGSGSFTALPVLETQIAVYNAADGNDSLRAVYPAGPTVSAELAAHRAHRALAGPHAGGCGHHVPQLPAVRARGDRRAGRWLADSDRHSPGRRRRHRPNGVGHRAAGSGRRRAGGAGRRDRPAREQCRPGVGDVGPAAGNDHRGVLGRSPSGSDCGNRHGHDVGEHHVAELVRNELTRLRRLARLVSSARAAAGHRARARCPPAFRCRPPGSGSPGRASWWR